MIRTSAFLLATLTCAFASAQISILSGTATADNTIDAYLSTSPTALGTAFLSGANWQSTFTGSIGIPAGGTYYLHVRATDLGLPAMFIGDFSLTGTNAVFAKTGTTSLSSSIANFDASSGAFPGDAFASAYDLGANGASPWGVRPQISAGARHIWAKNAAGADFTGADNPVYFTTAIRAVPEPSTIALLGVGALLLVRRMRG